MSFSEHNCRGNFSLRASLLFHPGRSKETYDGRRGEAEKEEEREMGRERDLIPSKHSPFVSCPLWDLNGSRVVLRHGRGLFFANTGALVYGAFLRSSTTATNLRALWPVSCCRQIPKIPARGGLAASSAPGEFPFNEIYERNQNNFSSRATVSPLLEESLSLRGGSRRGRKEPNTVLF